MQIIQFFSSQVFPQPWISQFGWTLVHFLWQGALIAALYAMARTWSRNPQVRYVMACAALAAMVAAPIATFFLGGGTVTANTGAVIKAVSTVSISPGVAPGPYTFTEFATHRDVMPWLVMAWFAGAIIFWIRLLGGWAIAARMRSMLVHPAPAEWQRKLDTIRVRVRVSRPVRLLVSALVQVPTVIGWLRPVVLVPIGALVGLPPEHVEALLAHELAHIRRHDYLTNILQSVAEALLFYHPAVWWVSRQIRNERELCCDDVAVSLSGDALIYVRALAELESSRPAHFNPALAANGGSLTERMGRLLGQSMPRFPVLPGPGAIVAAMLIVMTAYGLFAQSQAAPVSFEAVSIKPNSLGRGHVHQHTSTGRLSAYMTTRVLIQEAFGIKDFQISGGPAWVGDDNYNIEATTGTPIDLPDKVLEPCLQSLLADRFHLKYHHEMKQLPVYSLVAAKNGPKLMAHTGDRGEGVDSEGGAGKVTMSGTKLSMTGFANFLARSMDRPVVDNTGIKGEFDVKLEWSPDEAAGSSGPSIFTALQEQLGLRLESTKGPVEILVIDSVEKPSEN